MGLAIIGAVLGALFGYLYGIDRQRTKTNTDPREWAVGGAIFGAALLPVIGSFYGV